MTTQSQTDTFIAVLVMHTSDITSEEAELAMETIDNILGIADAKDIPIMETGRLNYERSNGQLVPDKNVDEYVKECFDSRRKQVNADDVVKRFLIKHAIKRQPGAMLYKVILTAQDLYVPGTNFIVGNASPDIGTIISVKRFRNLGNKQMERETKKQELYHEVGHVFGLPNNKRGFGLEESLGAHCTNVCAMRQGLIVPDDWIGFVHDREQTKQVYCDWCAKDLKAYFRSI